MRSIGLVLTVVFVFASSALLVGPASAQSSSNGAVSGYVCQSTPYSYGGYDNASIQGQSCDYYGGGNLPGTKVYLSKPATIVPPAVPFNRSASGDDNGFFAFKDVPAGDYTLTATRAGFTTQTFKLTITAGVALRQDAPLEPKDIAVTGSVTKSSDGKPLADAVVTACCNNRDGTPAEAKTGSDGKFSLKTKAGWQSLGVRRSGYIEQNVYEVLDGTRSLDFALEPIPPQDAKVHGVVRDQDGKPVPDATISISNYGYCCYDSMVEGDAAKSSYGGGYGYPSHYSGANWTQTDAQGRYAMSVYSGDNQVQAYKEGYAGFSFTLRVERGEDLSKDLEMKKFPDKTAHLVGRVVDSKTGAGLRYATINVNSPEFGIYECSVEEAYATSTTSSGSYDPSTNTSGGPNTWSDPSGSHSDSPSESSGTDHSGTSAPTTGSSGMSIAYPYPGPYYDPGCRIVVHPDGTFDGMVTPGYSTISVYYDSYRACPESHDADGSYTRTCGPEYMGWSGTFELAPDATTEVRVPLKARPTPDAVVSGYLVDSETGQAIPDVQISFSNEDRMGYGWATTDGDGSYKLRLRSGYHQVYVYAEGYLPWQGVLDVPADDETPFDVKLKPGYQSYGGCCYPYPMYASDMAMASSGTYAATETSAQKAADGDGDGDEAAAGGLAVSSELQSGQSGDAVQYEDLGGGLGPYDAEERAKLLTAGEDDPLIDGPGGVDIPAPGLLLAALAVLGAVLLVRRRLR